MKTYKKINRSLVWASLWVATGMISCTDDGFFETSYQPVISKAICFGADIAWPMESENARTVDSNGNRVSNFSLQGADEACSLPVGVYVQDGITSTDNTSLNSRGSVITDKASIESFHVWATYKKSEEETDAINYFQNVSYKKGTDGVYRPESVENEYYWPGNGTLDFVALANASTSFVANTTETAIESFTYTVPTDPTAQNDIMLAKTSAPGTQTSSVPLTFNHIMSAVNVKIGSVVNGEIRSITFKNVYNKGTYLVDRGVWVIDRTSVGDFTVKMEGNKFVVNDNTLTETLVNASNATFMMIPQNPGENAEMVIEFYDNETGHLYSDVAGSYKPALRGSISDDNWDMCKTTNYMLSIDESFTMKIEPVGKKLDAHYIIGYANVTVEGIDDWTITASTSDGSIVTLLPEEEVNPLAKQGFWTDKVVDANGNITTESARGASSWSGTGNVSNKKFYIFIPENINNKDREINLILKGNGSSTASTTKVLLQKYPDWTVGGFGWETVDDDESGKYGFKWTRKVAYIYPYTWTLTDLSGHEKFVKNFVSSYGANANDFATVVRYIHSGSIVTSKRYYILLDYSKLNNITGANSATEGFNNTLALYRQAGTTATSQFETILKTTLKTESGKETENMFRLPNDDEVNSGKVPAESGTANDLSAIMEFVQKKNKYYVQKKSQTDSDGKPIVTYVPYFFEEDLKWYLPAYGQFQYFVPNPNVAGDAAANYWSSTTAGTTTAWTGGQEEKDRDLEYRVIAVRKDENGYGNATVQVNNSSLKGGENGNTNNWIE